MAQVNDSSPRFNLDLNARNRSNSTLLISQKKQKSTGQTEEDQMSPIYGGATLGHISPSIECAGIAVRLEWHVGKIQKLRVANDWLSIGSLPPRYSVGVDEP